MKIYLIYHKLFDFDGKELTIGGIQTYLLNLAKVLANNDMEPIIYQLANQPWAITYNGIEIRGVKKLQTNNSLKQSKLLLNEVLKVADKESDLVIWGTDTLAVKTDKIKTLAIQHGIGFDFIANGRKSLRVMKALKLQLLYKFLQRHKSLSSFMRSEHKVCVDYNYLNWVRTMLPREDLKNIHVIPNFTYINDRESINQSENAEIKILFARRFSEERGVLILIDIIEGLMKKYKNISFTIAGDGPYSELLHEKYDSKGNITITKYEQSESLEIHSKHHIAIIPTYGSEGTSLSLLEAMTSGCVPVASNVGGMTNIILDGYNGFLVEPTAEAFIAKLVDLIENESSRKDISAKAKQSADAAFSYSLWEQKWLKVIYNAIQ